MAKVQARAPARAGVFLVLFIYLPSDGQWRAQDLQQAAGTATGIIQPGEIFLNFLVLP